MTHHQEVFGVPDRRLSKKPRRSSWTRFMDWMTAPAMKGMVVGGFVILGLFLFAGFIVTNRLSHEQHQSDLRTVKVTQYTTDIGIYAQAVSTYKLCLDSVARSDKNRQQWETIADVIEQSGPNGAKFAKTIRNGPLLSSPAVTVDSCKNPGDPPKPPA